ncbi:MAG: hypothetical protein RLZZ182_1846 [Pseudomonadota bacterium]|jgi:hypothetical protein
MPRKTMLTLAMMFLCVVPCWLALAPPGATV